MRTHESLAADPSFAPLIAESDMSRANYDQKHWFIYTLADSILGMKTEQYSVIIDQGYDFHCQFITASAYSFLDEAYDPTMMSFFPHPVNIATLKWAGRGLLVHIIDTRAGRDLTSGFVPFELIAAPGYGLAMTNPLPFRYVFTQNTRIEFRIRNLDYQVREHTFNFALHGYKLKKEGE